MASLALLLFFAAPSYSQDMENMMQNMKEKAKEKMETTQQAPQVATHVAAARAGNGFICTGDDKGFGCACKKSAPASDVTLSCKGLPELCKILGGTYNCQGDWCSCGGVYRQ
jgi:hypothetical protein